MRILLIIPAFLFLFCFSGCVPYETVKEIQERQTQIDNQLVSFYSKMADSYFTIGWQYYNLAGDFEKAGKDEEAQKYARQAKIYFEFYEELKQNREMILEGTRGNRILEPPRK